MWTFGHFCAVSLCCVCAHLFVPLCVSGCRDGTTSPVDPYSSVLGTGPVCPDPASQHLWFRRFREVACLRSRSQRLGTKSSIPRPRPPSSSHLPPDSHDEGCSLCMTPGKLGCPRVGLVILTALLMLFILRFELHGVQGCDVQACGKQMTDQLEWAVLPSLPRPFTLADDQGRPATGTPWDCWPPGTHTFGSMLPRPFWKGLDQVPLPGLVVWPPVSPAVMEHVVIGRRQETLSLHPRIR